MPPTARHLREFKREPFSPWTRQSRREQSAAALRQQAVDQERAQACRSEREGLVP